MNTSKYRLIKARHFRSEITNGDPTPKLIRFVRGDVLVPSDSELGIMRNAFDGPLPDETELTTPGTGGFVPQDEPQAVQTVKDRAKAILASPEGKLRDAIRKADAELIEAMLAVEGENPRNKVVEMLTRRQKSFETVAQ